MEWLSSEYLITVTLATTLGILTVSTSSEFRLFTPGFGEGDAVVGTRKGSCSTLAFENESSFSPCMIAKRLERMTISSPLRSSISKRLRL